MFILGMVLDFCPCVSLEVWILGGAIMRSGRKMSVNVLPSRSLSPGTGLSTVFSLLNKSEHSRRSKMMAFSHQNDRNEAHYEPGNRSKGLTVPARRSPNICV
jgi:hypothetical protein